MNDIIKINNPKRVFFTSDTHFGHENIMKFCNRPFNSVEEMDEALIENWNNKVPENGIVFHLGDFAFKYTQKRYNELINRLNGKIYLVIGNHDWKTLPNENNFELVEQQLMLKIDNKKIYLNHLPFLCLDGVYGNNSPKMVWQLFGHVHSKKEGMIGLDKPRLDYLFDNQYDVGVDNNNYTPVSYYEVKKIIEAQEELLKTKKIK